MKNSDVLAVMREYFHGLVPGVRLICSVRTGWAHEGLDLYAYDRASDWYFTENVPTMTVEAAMREGFGPTFGKHLTQLRNTILEHYQPVGAICSVTGEPCRCNANGCVNLTRIP